MIKLDKKYHKYTNNLGEHYQSVTNYINQFKPEFPKEIIAAKVALKNDCDIQEVLDEWDLAGKIAIDFGNAIHGTIESYVKYGRIPKHKILKKVIGQFKKLVGKSKIISEKIISNNEVKLAGTIDLIILVGERKVKLVDYKTNGEFKKSGGGKLLTPYDFLRDNQLDMYSFQLNIYKYLIEKMNYEVVGMEIWHYTDKFEIINAKEINLII